jgi:hypothetical protein
MLEIVIRDGIRCCRRRTRKATRILTGEMDGIENNLAMLRESGGNLGPGKAIARERMYTKDDVKPMQNPIFKSKRTRKQKFAA